MKTISPAQCGAVVEALRLGFTDLAPSILEKDLLITEVLGMLAAFDWGEIQAVFCGGTSLSKGHSVIQRMSEDIDFKLALPLLEPQPGPPQAQRLSQRTGGNDACCGF